MNIAFNVQDLKYELSKLENIMKYCYIRWHTARLPINMSILGTACGL